VLGRHLRDFLCAEGVNTSLLELLEGRTSPATLVLNDEKTGERSFVHHPGTNEDFALSEAALAAPCCALHFAAPELLAGLWPDGAVAAARRLKAAGRTLTLDTFAVDDPADPGGASLARAHEPFLALMDMVFPNENEARLVTGRTDLCGAASRFHELGVRVVAIKRGERGALVSWDGRFEEVPAERVHAVDTCGAGDNFSAGFLAGWLAGWSPLDATRLGCALGGLCVAHRGATTGTEDPKRLKTVLDRFGFLGRLTGRPGAL
jgi:sugar/nucleoside kinase (ribokinase family)